MLFEAVELEGFGGGVFELLELRCARKSADERYRDRDRMGEAAYLRDLWASRM